jgi:PHD/YefM family antitoxin component YafN of YafNO toxin-antitoxin module
MVAVTATDFAKSFGRYAMEAQREPVAITSYGRINGYYVSKREYDELQRLRSFARRVYQLKSVPADIAAAIEASQMDPAHEHLNALLDEKPTKTRKKK